eukprot:scaffold587_cov339-Prasinococcus_capsulatus_cf.AAC.2
MHVSVWDTHSLARLRPVRAPAPSSAARSPDAVHRCAGVCSRPSTDKWRCARDRRSRSSRRWRRRWTARRRARRGRRRCRGRSPTSSGCSATATRSSSRRRGGAWGRDARLVGGLRLLALRCNAARVAHRLWRRAVAAAAAAAAAATDGTQRRVVGVRRRAPTEDAVGPTLLGLLKTGRKRLFLRTAGGDLRESMELKLALASSSRRARSRWRCCACWTSTWPRAASDAGSGARSSTPCCASTRTATPPRRFRPRASPTTGPRPSCCPSWCAAPPCCATPSQRLTRALAAAVGQAKHFGLRAYVPQANNFVVYNRFWEDERHQRPSRNAGSDHEQWHTVSQRPLSAHKVRRKVALQADGSKDNGSRSTTQGLVSNFAKQYMQRLHKSAVPSFSEPEKSQHAHAYLLGKRARRNSRSLCSRGLGVMSTRPW